MTLSPYEVAAHDPEDDRRALCPCHEGSTRCRHWHHKIGPAPLLYQHHDTPPWTGNLPNWCDHLYRLRHNDGEWIYVAEPYSLGPDAFDDFTYLEQHGWQVSVTAYRARHYPGHTLAVYISRKEPTE